jgi:hypothetical protein
MLLSAAPPTRKAIHISTHMAQGDADGRVGDYLDDKLQTLADLDSLDALLESVRSQHTLLRKQVRTDR